MSHQISTIFYYLVFRLTQDLIQSCGLFLIKKKSLDTISDVAQFN